MFATTSRWGGDYVPISKNHCHSLINIVWSRPYLTSFSLLLSILQQLYNDVIGHFVLTSPLHHPRVPGLPHIPNNLLQVDRSARLNQFHVGVASYGRFNLPILLPAGPKVVESAESCQKCPSPPYPLPAMDYQTGIFF